MYCIKYLRNKTRTAKFRTELALTSVSQSSRVLGSSVHVLCTFGDLYVLVCNGNGDITGTGLVSNRNAYVNLFRRTK